MVRTYNSRLGSRNYNNYMEEAINRALRAVADDGLSLRRASEEHGIPFGTLYNKYHGRNIRKPGAQTVFSEKEEECILKSQSEDWAYSLLKRHKHKYSKRIATNVRRARAVLSRSVVDDHFSYLEVILKDIPPSNMFNYDESNISDDPGKSWLYIEEE
nr:unnamed protein product [Callosobruchus analis]